MQDIETIKDLSNAVHEIRDDYAVKLVKLHNKYWKNIDPEDKEQVIKDLLKYKPSGYKSKIELLEDIFKNE